MLNYDAILFDVDGTLIDSAPGIINTLKEVFDKMGVDTTHVNLRRYLGPPLRKSFGEHFTDPALIEKATNLYRDSYAVKGSHECAAYPGAAEMLQRLKDAGLPYISVCTDPTTGGVSASYAMLGDINITEPKALIGFAGRRVIENTIHQKLPADFQTSEYLEKHGFIDKIVERKDMKHFLAKMLGFWGF